MTESEIAKIVVDAAYHIHRRLGPGLSEKEKIAPVHKKQLLTYLRLADKRLGLLFNFGASLIKDGIFRVANRL